MDYYKQLKIVVGDLNRLMVRVSQAKDSDIEFISGETFADIKIIQPDEINKKYQDDIREFQSLLESGMELLESAEDIELTLTQLPKSVFLDVRRING